MHNITFNITQGQKKGREAGEREKHLWRTGHTHTHSLQKSGTAENYFVCVLWIYDCYLLQSNNSWMMVAWRYLHHHVTLYVCIMCVYVCLSGWMHDGLSYRIVSVAITYKRIQARSSSETLPAAFLCPLWTVDVFCWCVVVVVVVVVIIIIIIIVIIIITTTIIITIIVCIQQDEKDVMTASYLNKYARSGI
jgi:hypothetical protein